MPTFSKRQRLASWLGKCGLWRLLEWRFRRPGLLVLAYHRIGRRDDHLLDDGVLSATPEDFTAQVRYLRRYFELPSLESIIQSVQAGVPFARPTALITFDDGYQDNVDCALPILAQGGVPAVFFICPRFVGSVELPHWDRLAYVFKKAPRSFSLDYPFAYQVDLDQVSRPLAVMRYLEALAHAPQRFEESRLFEHVEARACVSVPVAALGQGLFATWDGVRRLAAAGMTLGSHCLTHRDLALLSEDEQRHELARSKALVEQEVGCSINAVAYPYGHRTDLTCRLVREAGYSLGFCYSGGMNPAHLPNRFDVHRVSVDCEVVWPQFRARLACYRALGRSLF